MAWPKLQAAGIIEQLKRKIASLKQQGQGRRQENEKLRRENEQLRRENEQLQRQQEQVEQERERLKQENERLKRQLEEAQRANKRQAAPFSRGRRKEKPDRPGRKPGKGYGQRHSKAIPEQVDEVIRVPLPERCDCGGQLKLQGIQSQFQQEIVRQTKWRRFDIEIGGCEKCHKRVQGRDPRQTSDALGAAAVQLGPEALALAVQMNKALAMPHADVATVLRDGFGLQVHRSTICRAVDRVARRGKATWHALRDAAHRSLVNTMDETGWKVEAQLRWLWVVANEQLTVCDILPGRGFAQASSLLSADYEGRLVHDGWKIYYKYLRAGHQSCNRHLIRRCEEMSEVASPAAARFPLQVKAVLEQGLVLRDRYKNHEISLHGLWTATGRLEAKLDRLLTCNCRDAANRRLRKHLRHERPYIFTYLYCPGLEATNYRGEQAIRALIGARKNWGGNRTERGARAQVVLTSILQTAKQQGKNLSDVIVQLLCCRDKNKILDFVPLARKTLASSLHPPPDIAISTMILPQPVADVSLPA